jgi:hypothetical protein
VPATDVTHVHSPVVPLLVFLPSKAFPVCTMRWLFTASPPFRFALPSFRNATLRFGVSLVQKVAFSSYEVACLPEVCGHVFLTMRRFDALAYGFAVEAR